MLQRVRVRTAEFPLNVHVVNVAEPPLMVHHAALQRARLIIKTPAIAYASCSEHQHPETLMYCIPEAP